MANLPLGFAEILVGGILLTRSIKNIQSATSGASSSSTSSNSSTGGSTATPTGAGLVNPFAKASGFTLERTDQGVDASMSPGSPILAPAPMKITAINQGWYLNQPQIVGQVTSGPARGKFIYLAEQVLPSVSVGDTVPAGGELGEYAQRGTGIEMGWAADAQGTTLARATSGYTEGQATSAGLSFRNFLASLGVK